MAVEIWVAIITSVPVTCGILLRYQFRLHESNQQKIIDAGQVAEKREERRERQSFVDSVNDPVYPAKKLVHFISEMQRICEETDIDRILFLACVNGREKPKQTTVILEWRQVGANFVYERLPIRQDYVDLVLEMRRKGRIFFKTEEKAGTQIGDYYKAEGVTEAGWFSIGHRKAVQTDQVAYKYASVATHREGGFEDMAIINREVDLLVSLARGMMVTTGFEPS